jgi:hypothetical protein
MSVLAVAALAAGCGGDDSKSDSGSSGTSTSVARNGKPAGAGDAQAISAVIKQGVTSKDVKVKCEATVTKKFVTTVYGSLAQCQKAEKPSPKDGAQPRDATIGDTKVEDNTASAKVTLVGGEASGASGTIFLAKEDDAWQVDDLGVDLLRSQLIKGVEGSLTKQIPQFRDRKIRDCFTSGLNKLSDDEFRTFAYAAIAEKPQAQKQLIAALTPCLAQVPTDAAGGGISFLRQQFEKGIERSIKADGGSQAKVDCIKRQLRRLISDKEIQSLTSGGGPTRALTQKTATAISSCK